jgi:plastocyanin
MRIKQTIIVSVLTIIICAAAALSREKRMTSQEKESGGAKVTITNNKFEPKTVTIKAGSEVTWENKEGTHTVTADDGSWTSPALFGGKTYSHKFDKPGKYPYYCSLHGGKGGHDMSGVVDVTP